MRPAFAVCAATAASLLLYSGDVVLGGIMAYTAGIALALWLGRYE